MTSLDKAKPGTPLATISGGWAEVRLFYVTPEDLLAQAYRNDHASWVESSYSPFLHDFPFIFRPC